MSNVTLHPTIRPSNMNRSNFIHRHNRFKPTVVNIFFLGFTCGMAITVIVFVICAFATDFKP